MKSFNFQWLFTVKLTPSEPPPGCIPIKVDNTNEVLFQNFFARISYWESMLENYNEQFRKLQNFAGTEEKIEAGHNQKMTTDLNSRFEQVVLQAESQQKVRKFFRTEIFRPSG